MTIPAHIREEAEACYLHCEQMGDNQPGSA